MIPRGLFPKMETIFGLSMSVINLRSILLIVVDAPSGGSLQRMCMRCGGSTLHGQKSPSLWRMCAG